MSAYPPEYPPASQPAAFSRMSRSEGVGQASVDRQVFQASSAFVAACQDATLALYALTAQVKKLQADLQKVDGAATTAKAPRQKASTARRYKNS
jgi:hypothetical protein